MSKTHVIVSAAANIALVKYWGKRAGKSNHPATGSLSIGLEDLRTQTRMEISDEGADRIDFEGPAAGKSRVKTYLNWVRRTFDSPHNFVVKTANNFPSDAGLASSASGFAALALAVNELLNLDLSNKELSRLAMHGSGSAARSVLGGYVEVVADDIPYARSLAAAEHWPLEIVVAIVDEGPKAIGSTEAMLRSANTSPYHQAWVDTHIDDMSIARDAVLGRDFEKLAEVAENSCLKMHASIMASRPSIIYWQPRTLEIIECVRVMRQKGIACFFTIDAGPQVKIICESRHLEKVSSTIEGLTGIQKVIKTRAGGLPIIT